MSYELSVNLWIVGGKYPTHRLLLLHDRGWRLVGSASLETVDCFFGQSRVRIDEDRWLLTVNVTDLELFKESILPLMMPSIKSRWRLERPFLIFALTSRPFK